MRERLLSIDFNIYTSSPEEFDRMLRSDIEAFSKVARAARLIAK